MFKCLCVLKLTHSQQHSVTSQPPGATSCLPSQKHKSASDVTSLTSCTSCSIQTTNQFFCNFFFLSQSGQLQTSHASPPSSFQILQQTQSATFSPHNEALCLFGGDAVFEKFCEASLFSPHHPPPHALCLFQTVSRFKMSLSEFNKVAGEVRHTVKSLAAEC